MKVITLLIIYVLIAPNIFGQKIEPLDLAKSIFSKNRLFNINDYVTGEYKGRPNGYDLGKKTKTKFTLIEQNEKIAVVNMTIIDSLGKGMDTYLFFEKNTIWKMSAFRGLAMTGMLEQMKNELEKMTPEQVKEAIVNAKQDKENHSLFSSIEEYNLKLGNLKLTLALDDSIAKHFLDNQPVFEQLKDIALTQLESELLSSNKNIKLIENEEYKYKKIFVSAIWYDRYEFSGCIKFLIGGMIDNEVGYLYIADEKDVPKMEPNSIILIKKIANNWYIYKTT